MSENFLKASFVALSAKLFLLANAALMTNPVEINEPIFWALIGTVVAWYLAKFFYAIVEVVVSATKK